MNIKDTRPTNAPPPAPTVTFAEPEAQRLLARAAVIDASRKGELDAAALRAIAAEAGISEYAVNQALSEQAHLSRSTRSFRRAWSWLRIGGQTTGALLLLAAKVAGVILILLAGIAAVVFSLNR